jgi:hypothetical protein
MLMGIWAEKPLHRNANPQYPRCISPQEEKINRSCFENGVLYISLRQNEKKYMITKRFGIPKLDKFEMTKNMQALLVLNQ